MPSHSLAVMSLVVEQDVTVEIRITRLKLQKPSNSAALEEDHTEGPSTF
jgi:hypothetical protein